MCEIRYVWNVKDKRVRIQVNGVVRMSMRCDTIYNKKYEKEIWFNGEYIGNLWIDPEEEKEMWKVVD